MEALGGLGGAPGIHPGASTALYRGEWWAPKRTAALRRSAAAALRRIGTPKAMAILEEAATNGPRGVRNMARTHMRMPPQRERQHT